MINTDLGQLNSLSEQLLFKVKMGEDTRSIQTELQNLCPNFLHDSLTNESKKMSFWINIYNAYYQILRIETRIIKPDIYKQKLFVIVGKSLSLDDVEHGILRKYRYKYSLGFFRTLFIPKFIKKNAVKKLDYRIHFALNCGAKSCPPIAFYKPTTMSEQLDIATQSFLEQESTVDELKNVVITTALFKWFYADFGGKVGIRRIFKDQLNLDISGYKIKYNEYSWEDELVNFIS